MSGFISLRNFSFGVPLRSITESDYGIIGWCDYSFRVPIFLIPAKSALISRSNSIPLRRLPTTPAATFPAAIYNKGKIALWRLYPMSRSKCLHMFSQINPFSQGSFMHNTGHHSPHSCVSAIPSSSQPSCPRRRKPLRMMEEPDAYKHTPPTSSCLVSHTDTYE